MFREGTRNGGDRLLSFEKEAFHLSTKAKMKILPNVVQKHPLLNHRSKIFSQNKVKAETLNPIV